VAGLIQIDDRPADRPAAFSMPRTGNLLVQIVNERRRELLTGAVPGNPAENQCRRFPRSVLDVAADVAIRSWTINRNIVTLWRSRSSVANSSLAYLPTHQSRRPVFDRDCQNERKDFQWIFPT